MGCPKNSAAAVAIARRVSSTTSCGTESSSGRSTTSATAPRATASAAKSWPSARAPRTQKNNAPGPTAPASYARSLSSTGARPTTSFGASAAIKRSSCISAVESIPRCSTFVTVRVLFRHTCGATLAAGNAGGAKPPPGWGAAFFEPGGQFSGLSGGTSRYWSANWASSWKAGAATTPPQMVEGSSTVTRITSRGLVAGTNPTNDAT